MNTVTDEPVRAVIRIHCDICGEFGPGDPHSYAEAFELARRAGWTVKTSILCPACKQAAERR